MEDLYKILYVDEEQIWRDNFIRYAHQEFNTEAIAPPQEPTELIKLIRSGEFHAVILDHLLSEQQPDINYDGIDILKRIKNKNNKFPIFVLTSHDLQAMEVSDDVNYVYPKTSIAIKEKNKHPEGKGEFNDRIRLQIKHYLASIVSAEKELDELITKADQTPLNIKEEERLIELDTFLNEQIGKELDIPVHLKTQKNAELIQELIDVSESLMQSISKEYEKNNA